METGSAAALCPKAAAVSALSKGAAPKGGQAGRSPSRQAPTTVSTAPKPSSPIARQTCGQKPILFHAPEATAPSTRRAAKTRSARRQVNPESPATGEAGLTRAAGGLEKGAAYVTKARAEKAGRQSPPTAASRAVLGAAVSAVA